MCTPIAILQCNLNYSYSVGHMVCMHELHAFVHTDCYCACVYTYRLLLHTVAHPKCDWPLETHINRRAHCAHSLNLERSTSKHQAPPLSPCCNHHRCPSTPNCHSCVLQLLCRTQSAASPSSILPYVGAVRRSHSPLAWVAPQRSAGGPQLPTPHDSDAVPTSHDSDAVPTSHSSDAVLTSHRCIPPSQHTAHSRRSLASVHTANSGGPHITHTALQAALALSQPSRTQSHTATQDHSAAHRAATRAPSSWPPSCCRLWTPSSFLL